MISVHKNKQDATRIVRINMDRNRTTVDFVFRYVKGEDIDITIVAEPNKKAVVTYGWYVNTWLDAAIAVSSGKLSVVNHGRGSGFEWIKAADMVVYSCYISPRVDFRVVTGYMTKLSRDMRKHTKPVIVAGDFNAKSTGWDPPQGDRRGILVAEWATQEGLTIANKGDKPTFVREIGRAHV